MYVLYKPGGEALRKHQIEKENENGSIKFSIDNLLNRETGIS
jgi:hypothetical protein